MLIKKVKSIINEIDDFYINNFNYNNLRNNVFYLQSKFEEKDILIYFIEYSKLRPNESMKYLYPIQYLSIETITNNTDIIIENISEKQLIWLIKVTENKDLHFLLIKWVIRQILLSKNIKTIKSLRKYLYEYKGIKELEDILVSVYKTIVDSPFNSDTLNDISEIKKYISSSNEKMQDLIIHICTNQNVSEHIIKSILLYNFSEITMERLIEFYNNIKNYEDKHKHIFEVILKQLHLEKFRSPYINNYKILRNKINYSN